MVRRLAPATHLGDWWPCTAPMGWITARTALQSVQQPGVLAMAGAGSPSRRAAKTLGRQAGTGAMCRPPWISQRAGGCWGGRARAPNLHALPHDLRLTQSPPAPCPLPCCSTHIATMLSSQLYQSAGLSGLMKVNMGSAAAAPFIPAPK